MNSSLKVTFLFLLILISVVALARSTEPPLLGKDPCTWGPSYWCKSEKTQKECGSYEYCKKNKNAS